MSKRLKFGDEVIHATTIKTSGDVAMAESRIIGHDEEVSIVGRCKLDEYAVKDLDGPTTLVHKTKLRNAQVVSDEYVADVLAEEIEYTTGQLQLLSGTGESRRATRLGLEERQRQQDELDYTVEHDDAHDTDHLLDCAERQTTQLRELVKASDEWELQDYFEALETQWVQLMATAVAGVEYGRRRVNEHLEAEARRKAQERAEQEQATAAAMATHSDEEADKRERREVGGDDTSEAGTEQAQDEEVVPV